MKHLKGILIVILIIFFNLLFIISCNDDREGYSNNSNTDPPEDIIEEVLKCQLVCANCHRLISTKAKHQKENLTYFTVGDETFGSKGILERMSAPAPDREYLRSDS